MSNEFYFNEDKTMVAVLVSHGYGTGWSTANPFWPDIAYNPEVVKLFMEVGPADDGDLKARQTKLGRVNRVLRDIYGDGPFNLLGWNDIDIEWIPVGTLFRVDEYDGAEGIEEFDPCCWILAGGKEVL